MTGDEKMTIRQMCDTFGVTARTLRFYEAKGLLSPEREGARRIYGRRERARLTIILNGRRFGFPLEDMRELLDLYNLGDQQRTQISNVIAAARERLAIMEAQRDDMIDIIADLKDQISIGEAVLADMKKVEQL